MSTASVARRRACTIAGPAIAERTPRIAKTIRISVSVTPSRSKCSRWRGKNRAVRPPRRSNKAKANRWFSKCTPIRPSKETLRVHTNAFLRPIAAPCSGAPAGRDDSPDRAGSIRKILMNEMNMTGKPGSIFLPNRSVRRAQPVRRMPRRQCRQRLRWRPIRQRQRPSRDLHDSCTYYHGTGLIRQTFTKKKNASALEIF